MNFVLVHFLAKSCWSLLVVAVQIVWFEAESSYRDKENKNALHYSLSASSKKINMAMHIIEKQQAVASHKGLQQRRSFCNFVQKTGTNDLESAPMSRQSSNQSQQSSTSLASDIKDENTSTGQPINFGTVAPGVYRCSYPNEANYPFLQKLGLKTIITLVDKEFPETFKPFMQANSIRHCHITMAGTKKETIPVNTMQSILEVIHDKQNHPVLIHCNQGRHRTGCVVAVTRKLQKWNIDRIVDEYKTYAQPKPRDCDIEYISKFEVAEVEHLGLVPLLERLAIQSKPRRRSLRHFLPAALLVLAFLSILSIHGMVEHRFISETFERHDQTSSQHQ